MKKIMTVLALIAGTLMVGGSPASAHTPAITADCNGVAATMVNAPDGFKSILTVTVAGKTLTKEIVGNGSLTAPVPQDGATSAWSAAIDNDGFSDSGSGNVGPCGEKPVVVPDKPKPIVDSEASEAVDCAVDKVTITTTTTTTDWALVDNVWVKKAPVTTKNVTTREATDQECAPPVDVPEFKPYEVQVCYQMDNPDGVKGTYEWPQTRVSAENCDVTPKCDEVNEYQHDTYWIRDEADKKYFENLHTLNSPADDAQLEPHDYYGTLFEGADCGEVVEPPADVDVCPLIPGNQPEDTDCGEDVSPPGDENPPAVTPPTENPRVVVTVTARTPAANAPVKAPVATSAGVLPNTGGTNMAALLSGLAFMFMGAFALVCGSRRPRKN